MFQKHGNNIIPDILNMNKFFRSDSCLNTFLLDDIYIRCVTLPYQIPGNCFRKEFGKGLFYKYVKSKI